MKNSDELKMGLKLEERNGKAALQTIANTGVSWPVVHV